MPAYGGQALSSSCTRGDKTLGTLGLIGGLHCTVLSAKCLLASLLIALIIGQKEVKCLLKAKMDLDR